MTSHDGRSTRILVVDDDPDWRELLCTCLEDLGYAAVAARSGEAALERLREERFSVVLLDLRMPGMGGDELVTRLPPDPPRIVFLTSAPASEVGEALYKGPHYYLPKGATPAELSLMLESLGA